VDPFYDFSHDECSSQASCIEAEADNYLKNVKVLNAFTTIQP